MSYENGKRDQSFRYGLLVLAVILAAMLIPAGSSAAPNPVGHRRFERTVLFSTPWQASCGPSCGFAEIVEVTVTSPGGVSAIDLVSTLSFDFSISDGDGALVDLNLRSASGAPLGQLRPGAFSLVAPSADLFTSTSLQWVRTNLPASGVTYKIVAKVRAVDADASGSATVQGGKLTLVTEMWGTGP
jgi:hypothetical protein